MKQRWRRKRRKCCGCSAQLFSTWRPLYSSRRWQDKVPWGFRSLQSALSGTGSEFPTYPVSHPAGSCHRRKGLCPLAFRHLWPDVFGLSGAARSPSWCSHCPYRHSLSRCTVQQAKLQGLQGFLGISEGGWTPWALYDALLP